MSTIPPVFTACAMASTTRRFCNPSRPVTSGFSSPRMTRRNARSEVRADRRVRAGSSSTRTACTRNGPPSSRNTLGASSARRATHGADDHVRILVAYVAYALFSCDVCSQLLGDAAVSESRNVPSAPLAKRSVIATVSSTSKPRVAFDANAWTATISPDHAIAGVDLVDHVDENRPAARTPAPVVGRIEVAVDRGLAENGAAHHADEPAERARRTTLDRLVQDRAVPAMCPTRLVTPAFSAASTSRSPCFERMRDRLLDEHGTPAAMHTRPCSR